MTVSKPPFAPSSLRMARATRAVIGLGFLALVVSTSQAQSMNVPATVFWDGQHMAAAKEAIEGGSRDYASELRQVGEDARKARQRGPYTVTDKSEQPPSGDRHDYLSFSRYWWPDPEKPDGLPYIRHDGRVNRKLVARGDRKRLGLLFEDIVPLALANFFLRDDRAGEHADRLLRVWFLDPATLMNPHMNYAQGIPGREHGRGVGIIDTRGFIWLLDSVELLRTTGAVSKDSYARLQAWFTEYLDWLNTSRLADDEHDKSNNHGSWYAAQQSRIAIFVGRPLIAKRTVEEVRDDRFQSQIRANGSQPLELERTQPLHYSLFNLAALTCVARSGECVDVDIWNDRFAAAFDFLEPYACGDKPTPYKQIRALRLSTAEQGMLALVAARMKLASAARMLREVEHKVTDPWRLKFPEPHSTR